MALDPITAALDVGGKLIDRLWPDPAQRDQARLAMLEMAQKGELAEFSARAEIVKTEAASSHWLAANWRPLTMLTFAGLIVARWFGLGGYVVGRSVEKIAPSVAEALKR